MKRVRSHIAAITVFLAVMAACNKVPDYVIPPDRMAELMADIHIGESVVESNYQDYPSDSMRTLMKQSILAHHGYTFEQLDTSFVWYGHNLDKYREVYDKTVEILEKRLAEAGESEALLRRYEVSGDSTNVWTGSDRYVIRPGSPSRFLTFELKSDPDWKTGDIYTVRAKFTNAPSGIRFTMMADYSDGSREMLTTRFSNDGWHELSFYLDSLKTAETFYGTLEIPAEGRSTIIVDSIELIRKPLVPEIYNMRYRQRSFPYYNRE